MATPGEFRNMQELRAAIDELDRDIVRLFARRAALIDEAIRLKAELGLPARIDERVEEVAANARRNALAEGIDPDHLERLWRQIIDWSIAREERVLGQAQASGGDDASLAADGSTTDENGKSSSKGEAA